MSDEISEILKTNERQKEFYNSQNPQRKNLPTRIWSGIRNGLLSDYRKNYDIKDKVYNVHVEWLGDLSDKKVLDLGCLRGNALSLYIAESSKKYIGIDLSDTAIAQLQKKIDDKNIPHAKAVAVDFLSKEFDEKDFDIIYAYGVLHHFENFDLLVNKLNEKLAPGGIIISYDPLQTSPPIKFVRALYRPFQSDKDWEWPFSETVLKKLDSNFKVLEKRGILGSSKYGIPLNFLPLGKNFKKKKIQKMIEKDWNATSWNQIHKCMHVTMKLEKKG